MIVLNNISHTTREQHGNIAGIIHAISLIMATRDPYTASHQQRVAELACAIASEMKLPEWQIEGIRVTGLLHDIGKIAIPSEILNKPGAISRDEFCIVKSHPELGFKILSGIEFPWPVNQAILQHHERLNGSGYPGGLCHHEIILEARILGVADVIEAMTSHRPYRPAFDMEYALQEISAGRGILYDRDTVDACLILSEHRGLEFTYLPSAETFLRASQAIH